MTANTTGGGSGVLVGVCVDVGVWVKAVVEVGLVVKVDVFACEGNGLLVTLTAVGYAVASWVTGTSLHACSNMIPGSRSCSHPHRRNTSLVNLLSLVFKCILPLSLDHLN